MQARLNLKPLFCLTALLVAGFFMPSASAATFVYVGNADSQDVTVLELKSNGDLTPVETAAVPGPAKPGGSLPLAVGPRVNVASCKAIRMSGSTTPWLPVSS